MAPKPNTLNTNASTQILTPNVQTELMPAMKSFYSPLKKAISKVQKDNSEWAGKYKKEVKNLKSAPRTPNPKP